MKVYLSLWLWRWDAGIPAGGAFCELSREYIGHHIFRGAHARDITKLACIKDQLFIHQEIDWLGHEGRAPHELSSSWLYPSTKTLFDERIKIRTDIYLAHRCMARACEYTTVHTEVSSSLEAILPSATQFQVINLGCHTWWQAEPSC